jgi:tetratricopeptide (TPR) repeat protein
MRILASLVLITLLAFEPRAFANPPSESSLQFEKGKAAYRLGEFDEAIAAFREGYRLKPDPVFLYNIALAYRGKEDFEKAIFFYQSYLREAPNAHNRAQVEAKIEELGRAVEEKRRAAESPPKTPLSPDGAVPDSTPAEVTPAPQPVETRRKPTLLIVGSVVGGLGVVSVVAGALLLANASATQADIDEASAMHLPWTDELADRDAAARRNSTLGVIAVGAGGTMLVAGGVIVLLGLKQGRRTEVVPTASSDGVGVSIRGTF